MISESPSSSPPLSILDIAARIRRMPPGPAQTQALRAFTAKYSDSAKQLLAQHNSDIQQEERQRYLLDPVSWIKDKIGEDIWSKQRQIIESVRDNRRTAVKSAHDQGKSYIASRIALWWLDTHTPGEAFVVSTAPSGPQVRAILWREINRAHAKGTAKRTLSLGRTNQTELWLQTVHGGQDEMVAYGRKPADLDPSAFQGIHVKYVLVIIDEACGVPRSIFDAADTLITNEYSKILAIGNPDDPLTEFGEICKPGSGWNVIRISAFDSPNFTKERYVPSLKPVLPLLMSRTWEEEKRKKWGVDNPLYTSKVLGEFPTISTDSLIPFQWITRAQERYRESVSAGLIYGGIGPVELGVDVGGGSDKSTIALRTGPRVKIVHKDQNPDTMQTLSSVLDWIEKSNATKAKVDNIGIGHGAVDRAKEMSEDKSVIRESPALASRASRVTGINVGERAEDTEHFVNLRAEGYWSLREKFDPATGFNIELDPDDEDLAAQLADIKYKRSAGRIQIESKDDMKKRGRSSPDDADAVMLAFLSEKVTGPKKIEVTW